MKVGDTVKFNAPTCEDEAEKRYTVVSIGPDRGRFTLKRQSDGKVLYGENMYWYCVA